MMTRNNKVVLGVAAGVAALAVAGMYAKKKGYLNNVNTSSLKNSLGGLKETAMKAFSGSTNGSSEGSSMSGSSSNGSSMGSSSTGSTGSKKKSSSNMSTGNTGDINPATT